MYIWNYCDIINLNVTKSNAPVWVWRAVFYDAQMRFYILKSTFDDIRRDDELNYSRSIYCN